MFILDGKKMFFVFITPSESQTPESPNLRILKTPHPQAIMGAQDTLLPSWLPEAIVLFATLRPPVLMIRVAVNAIMPALRHHFNSA